MKPRAFIASSSEALTIAKAIQLNLDHVSETTLWNQNVFLLGGIGLDDLIRQANQTDFAVFIFQPDDAVKMRNEDSLVVRDNVLFELGLFMGKLSRERMFVVHPRGQAMHFASDLAGFNRATYELERSDNDPVNAVGAACTQIELAINKIVSSPRDSSSTAPQSLNARSYYLKNAATHKYLEVVGYEDESSIKQSTYKGLDSQKWMLIGGPYDYRITNVQTWRCLDVYNLNEYEGAPVVVWRHNPALNQVWRVIPFRDNLVRFVALHSNKCLDVGAGDTSDDAKILQWSHMADGSPAALNQLWELIVA